MTTLTNFITEDGKTITLDELRIEYNKMINIGTHGYQSPLKRIQADLKNRKDTTKEEFLILSYLANESCYNKIINATIPEMREIIKKFSFLKSAYLQEKKDKSGNVRTDENGNTLYEANSFGKNLVERLGYPRLRDDGDRMLKLLSWFNIKSCPYCNSQYVLTIDTVKNKNGRQEGFKKALFQLDHFFPKSLYPFLAISFYNLIPSCSYCNNLKSSRDTLQDDTIHPYFDDFDDLCRFRGEPKRTILHMLHSNAKLKISIEILAKAGSTEYTKIKNHNEDFNIEALYQNHLDVVEELYWKSIAYNKSKRKELDKLFKEMNIPLTKKEINRFITGNYTDKEDILKRPLAKLTKDISEELGLI